MDVPTWLDRSAWPYAPRIARVTEGRLHYVDEGAGTPVVLVHGTPTWSFEWRHVIAGLRDRARVIAPDHLGFGLSDRPATARYRPEDHAHRFREWIAAVLPSERIHLVVHDYGGPFAFDWALDHPDRLRSLTVLNSWMWPFDDDPSMLRKGRIAGSAIGRFLYRHLNASQRLIMPSAYGDRRKLTPAIHAQYLSAFPDKDSRERVLFALAQAILSGRAFYQTLWARRAALESVPMQLLWGMRDTAFPPHVLRKWQQTFPRARTVALASAGHWPHEEEPAAVVDALQAWIQAFFNPGPGGAGRAPAK
jgi:haloalkane dehalogenase